jgi:hypothetical protein
MKTKDRWVPLRRANMVQRLTDEDVQHAMIRTGQDEAATRAALEAELEDCEYWINDLYQVAKRQLYGEDGEPAPMVHLNIRRRDGKPILRDWRHFQLVKNQLIGEECEAVEIYPAESRLHDTSNKYHLWCFTDPSYRLPFGMEGRDVLDAYDKRPGYRQRKLGRTGP